MSDHELIEKIKKAKKIQDVLNVNDLKGEFAVIAKRIHPDICKASGASDAMAILTNLRDHYINGKQITDDAGTISTNGYFVKITGDKGLLQKSFNNLNMLRSTAMDAWLFHKYIPYGAKFTGGVMEFNLLRRGIPLSEIGQLDQKHVNWILSRLLEFSAWLERIGYVHGGFNLESIFVTPEDHGIQVVSFYHMKRMNTRLETVSAKYRNWYPAETFVDKMAVTSIDIELSKKIAISLLGDKSGSGIKLRKTHNADFINFVVNRSDNAASTYLKYRELLTKNFKKKFHVLDL